MQRVFSLLVDNNPGVLSRVSGLFSRRGYSIDSITAGVTADPRFTRITIVSSGDELILSQIEKQVRKLEDVIEIKVLDPDDSVYRELIRVKVRGKWFKSRCVSGTAGRLRDSGTCKNRYYRTSKRNQACNDH